ncbi:hypothetical protein HPY42_02900 [Coprothermobacteraceae bacterium]|nr:hypothetical protein [Coprothermobacteraceae bacterium]
MYYPERPRARKSVSGILLFALGLFIGSLLVIAGSPTVLHRSCEPETIVKTVTVTQEVCTATQQTSSTVLYVSPILTPTQAATASRTLSLELTYPTNETVSKADWVVFSGKVSKQGKAGAYYVVFWADDRPIMLLRTDFDGTFKYKLTRLPTEKGSTLNILIYALDGSGKEASDQIKRTLTP